MGTKAEEELNQYIAKLGVSPKIYSELMKKINNYALHIAQKEIDDWHVERTEQIKTEEPKKV